MSPTHFYSPFESLNGDAIEGEIPPQTYATPYGAQRLLRCGLLRGATQTVPRTVWLTPFESLNGDAIEGEIPPQTYATPYGAQRLLRCGLLRGATQTVPRTVWLTPFESLPIKTKQPPNRVVVLFGGEGEIRTLERG